MRISNNRFSAFTRIEFVVVIGVCVLMCFVVLETLRPARHISSRLTCSVNLKQFAFAAQMFKDAHAGYPWEVSTNHGGTEEFAVLNEQTFRHFQTLSNDIYVTLGLICPQDIRQAATNWGNLVNTNLSYFVGLDSTPSLPMSIVAGDRNITPDSSVIIQASPSTPPSWIKSVGLHGEKGHLVFSDGHVEELDSIGLANAIQRTGILTNHFAVP